MPKKILVVTERFYPEEFIINDLVLKLKTDGYVPFVLTQAPSYPFGKIFKGYKNKLFGKEIWNGIPVARFYTVCGYQKHLVLKLLNYLSFALAGSLIGLLAGIKFDLVFIFHTGPLTMALPGVVLGKRRKKPIFIWTQDVWPDSVYAYGFKQYKFLSYTLDKFVHFIYKNCAEIFVSCEGFIEKIRKYICGKKIIFMPNWSTFSVDDYSAASKIIDNKTPDKNQQKVFTFAGNIGKVQNLEQVILGFAKALTLKPDLGFLRLIGDGSALSDLKKLCAQRNIANIEFTGRILSSHIPEAFSRSDVLVISLTDKPIFTLTVPSKFQAYLTAQKPVFCIMKGEVAHLVEKYKIGLTADPSDIEDICRKFIAFSDLAGNEMELLAENSKTLLNEKYNRIKTIEMLKLEINNI